MFGGLLSKLQGGGALPTIDHAAFAHSVAQKAVAVIDVREPHEYAAGHVPGAVNMPLSKFSPAALPTSKPVVLICQAGGRSAKALQQALDAGCRDICHYAPGTGGWKNSGGAIEL